MQSMTLKYGAYIDKYLIPLTFAAISEKLGLHASIP